MIAMALSFDLFFPSSLRIAARAFLLVSFDINDSFMGRLISARNDGPIMFVP